MEALVKTGLPREAIEVHDTPQLLQDYCGRTTHYRLHDCKDSRFQNGDCGHVIVRRAFLGSSNNDAGFFVDKEKGESVVLLCDHSRACTKYNDSWLRKVRMEYDAEILRKKAQALGKPFQRVEKNGKIYAMIGA